MLISSAIQAQNLSIELVPTTYTGNYHVSCNGGSDGGIYANHENTSPPFTYLWSTGATTKSISGLQSGTYTVTVTDANSNTGTAQLTLTQPNVLASERVVSAYSTYQISEHGGTNGSISVTPTGGTASYTILWNDNDDKFNRNGLAAGSYSYVITDANGCTVQGSSTLTQPNPLQLSFSNVTGVSCNGYEDGSAQLTITGGIAPYQILWDNGSFSENPLNLPAGLREVHVTDLFENAETGQINISEPARLEVQLQSPQYANGFHVSCYDCFNGSITSTVNGGTAPYTYLWDGSGGGQTTANLSNLNAGDYILLVTDAHNCILEEAIKLRMPERQDWSMTGNTGTDPSTQFIGTTDSVDMVFKRNNQEAFRLTENGTLLTGSLYFDDSLHLKSYPGPSNMKILSIGIGNPSFDWGCWNQNAIGSLSNGTVMLCEGLFRSTWPNNPNAAKTHLDFGSDGNNGTIETYSEDPNGIHRLLINTSCGLDVFVGKDGATGNLIANNKLGVNISEPEENLHVVGKTILDGNVRIGNTNTTSSNYTNKLVVEGKIICRELFVTDIASWPDYVFEPDYQLMSIENMKVYFVNNKHLPAFKSIKEVEADQGVNVQETLKALLKTQEEQALYIVQLKEEINQLKTK